MRLAMGPLLVLLGGALLLEAALAWRPDVDLESGSQPEALSVLPANVGFEVLQQTQSRQDAEGPLGDIISKVHKILHEGDDDDDDEDDEGDEDDEDEEDEDDSSDKKSSDKKSSDKKSSDKKSSDKKSSDKKSSDKKSSDEKSSDEESSDKKSSDEKTTTGRTEGSGWCKASEPGFKLKSGKCDAGKTLHILSYNLFWWNLFKKRGGAGGSAGKNMKAHGPYDVIGFQECEDVNRVIRDAGMSGSMATFVGGHACCIAYNKDKFKLLSKGKKEVAEDERAQYYGKRGMMWVRLEYKEGGKTILFANHHGPLRVNSGGQCGGKATAWNIVNTLKEEAKGDDAIVIVGDFNADDKSVTQRELMRFMNRLGSNWVDTVMSNCKSGTWKTLPKGGSDHNAVKVELSI